MTVVVQARARRLDTTLRALPRERGNPSARLLCGPARPRATKSTLARATPMTLPRLDDKEFDLSRHPWAPASQDGRGSADDIAQCVVYGVKAAPALPGGSKLRRRLRCAALCRAKSRPRRSLWVQRGTGRTAVIRLNPPRLSRNSVHGERHSARAGRRAAAFVAGLAAAGRLLSTHPSHRRCASPTSAPPPRRPYVLPQRARRDAGSIDTGGGASPARDCGRRTSPCPVEALSPTPPPRHEAAAARSWAVRPYPRGRRSLRPSAAESAALEPAARPVVCAAEEPAVAPRPLPRLN